MFEFLFYYLLGDSFLFSVGLLLVVLLLYRGGNCGSCMFPQPPPPPPYFIVLLICCQLTNLTLKVFFCRYLMQNVMWLCLQAFEFCQFLLEGFERSRHSKKIMLGLELVMISFEYQMSKNLLIGFWLCGLLHYHWKAE